LLGVAVGNALGLPAEGSSHSSIRRRWPEGITEVDPRERELPWDDDLAQTVLLAEALLDNDELDLEDFAGRLLKWSRENGRGMGALTGEVMSRLAAGDSAIEASQTAWEQSGWSNAGNGAVTRSAPVALRWRRWGGGLVRTARASALVTHYDPRCEWSTVAFDVALCFALTDTALDLGELAGALQKVEEGEQSDAALEQVVEAVRAVPAVDLHDLALDNPMDMGYTLKAMQVGLWCLEHAKPPDVLLPEIVGAGGDTDTNGAVAGAVVGARAGATGIPARWVANVRDAERVTQIADRLLVASRR
jgi:ADP-ribosyl-[dinitrogen reductase] hydrolase